MNKQAIYQVIVHFLFEHKDIVGIVLLIIAMMTVASIFLTVR
jgi:hypothetical protein